MISVAIGTSRGQRGSGALARDTPIHWRRQGEAALGNGRTFCERRAHSSISCQSVNQPASQKRTQPWPIQEIGSVSVLWQRRNRAAESGTTGRDATLSLLLQEVAGPSCWDPWSPVSPARRKLRRKLRRRFRRRPSQAKPGKAGAGWWGGWRWEVEGDGLLTSDPHKGSSLSGAADHDDWHGTRTELTETPSNSKYRYTVDGCFVCVCVACCVCVVAGWATTAEKEGVTNAAQVVEYRAKRAGTRDQRDQRDQTTQ